MEFVAKLRNAKLSAQKARLVANLIRGMSAEKALNTLKFDSKKASAIIKKILESAIANAENLQTTDVDDLYISTVFVDEAPPLKRFKARAKGRANHILKRMCHITIKVSEYN
jgi:large subunit ribosomal protein L22